MKKITVTIKIIVSLYICVQVLRLENTGRDCWIKCTLTVYMIEFGPF